MLDDPLRDTHSGEIDPPISDAELVRRYLDEGSEAAFETLVHRHLNLVYSAALRHLGGDAHAGEDVAQTVFSALARKAPALRQHPALAGWLYTATHHAATKVRRSEVRRRAREQAAQLVSADSSGNETTDWNEVRPVIDAAMRDLSESDRTAVLLRFFSLRPFAEIGVTAHRRT